jgi:hypothetical protein
MRWLQFLIILLVLMRGSLERVAAAEPDLTVVGPQDGAVIEDNSVAVEFAVNGITLVPTSVRVAEAGKHPELNRPGEGHLHFVLDLQPLVVWEKNEPYTFEMLPSGEQLLMVELVQNDHSPLSPAVMRQIRFTSEAPSELPVSGSAVAPFHEGGSVLLALGVLLLAGGFTLRRST